jgi:hypothetical protein
MSCSKSRQSRASRQCVVSGKNSPPALALFAALPDVIVRANAAAAAVLAVPPLAVMLADARAPAVLAILASERERERETGREIFKSVGKGLGGMASKRKGVFNANARSCHK